MNMISKKIISYIRKALRKLFIIDKFEKLDKELVNIRIIKEDYIEKQNFEKAALSRLKERQLLTKIGWLKICRALLVFTILSLISIIANIFFPELGKNISIDFYSNLAQIFPILLIACYIERPIAKNMNSEMIRRAKFYIPRNRIYEFLRFTEQFDGVLTVIIGEILCLYAIATNQSSTFLLLMSSFSFLYIFKILIDNIMLREIDD